MPSQGYHQCKVADLWKNARFYRFKRFKGKAMKLPLSRTDNKLIYTGFSSLAILMLLFAAGCGGSGASGPPGAPPSAPAGAPPGAPIGAPHQAVQAPPASAPVSPAAPVTAAAPDKSQIAAANPAATPAGSPPGAPVAAPPGAPKTDGSKPADDKAAGAAHPDGTSSSDGTPPNPLAPMTPIKQGGNDVALASEIIASKANPFLGKLPKPVVATATPVDSGATPPPPPVDPFESVSLLGVVYNPKSPIALLGVSGGDSQSQVVRRGDVIMVDGGSVKVSAIRRDGIELQSLGTSKEKRTLSLPNLVGYSAGATAGAPTTGSNPDTHSVSKSAPPPGGGPDDHNLTNLKKLSGGGQGADVNLKEPQ